MTLWRVRVDCYRAEVDHPMIRRFLLEADDSHHAMSAGQVLAEETAPVFGTKWLLFQAREAVKVTLPLEV
jgi:hypothetical protein